MNRVAREWIEKAEADFRTAQREFRARAHPNYDAVCFHAQQAVEILRFLSKKAIDFRYPGHTADREVAARALSLARDIRDRLLSDVRENG